MGKQTLKNFSPNSGLDSGLITSFVRRDIKIGLFGYGCVGTGLYEVLHKTPGLKATIKKICVKDRNKQRNLPAELFTFDRDEVLYDPEINIIVELIDDADAAFEIVSTSIKNGKGVVSANKKMIAEHFEELLVLQRKYNVPFLYEAAVGASIPIIRNLEEYYDNDLLQSLEGIINGSSNYILTKTFSEKLDYKTALQQAQEKGYAESNPILDVEGYDAKYKLIILLAHAFGVIVKPEQVFNIGINRIGNLEMQYAREKGFKIKLVACAHKTTNDEVIAFVAPRFISPENKFYHVDDVFNGVLTETAFADKQFFVGKGAGAYPTGSAVLSDLSALTYNYRYEYKKLNQQHHTLTNDFPVEVFLRSSYKPFAFTDDFIEITEAYASRANHYVIGKINFQKLIRSEWIHDETISVIFTEKCLDNE